MKNPFSLTSLGRVILAALAVAIAAPAYAAPPDLTSPGAINALRNTTGYSKPEYDQTYNLGVTGLRGWIHINGDQPFADNGFDIGAYGLMTNTSRQILVTVAAAPGNVNFLVDDVILGATAATGGAVPLFTKDCRKEFGVAVGSAEAKDPAILYVKRWRAGVITDVPIVLKALGSYSETTPFACVKSNKIITSARTRLVEELLADGNFLNAGYVGSVNGLALLATVLPTDPDYVTVRGRLRSFAQSLASSELSTNGNFMWNWAYSNIFLSEYYLLGEGVPDDAIDTAVLQRIKVNMAMLADAQSRYGTYGHGSCAPAADGGPNGPTPPYGPVNAVGMPANIAMILGRKAMIAGSLPINPKVDQAIDRAAKFASYYMNKGSLPYGEHEPWAEGHASNGKDAMCAVLFSLLPDRAAETEYFARMSVAGYNGREYGHAGHAYSFLWNTLGVNVGGKVATARYMQKIQWQLDLARRTDGSFVYWGTEQYGAGQAEDGYLGKTVGYDGGNLTNPTASFLLTYGVSLGRIYLTGKNVSTTNVLSVAKVEHAINAATYKLDSSSYSTQQLMARLGDYDPVVRNATAVRLRFRPEQEKLAQVPALLLMATGSNVNERIGACQALGEIKPDAALSLLTQRLSDPDLWVRAVAAKALRNYGGDAVPQVTSMLNALVANATDPDVIVWSDPIQIANGFLSNTLTISALRNAVVNSDKEILYPAIKVALAQPDSMPRQIFSAFSANFPLVDVQKLAPEFLAVASTTAQADAMWHSTARTFGIRAVTRWKAAEAMPIALAMQYHEPFSGYLADEHFAEGLRSLAFFGDSARWTLPGLRDLLSTKHSSDYGYDEAVAAIASIEDAITSPTGITNLYAVADSKTVSTTGPLALTLTGSSCRMAPVKFTILTSPSNGTLSGVLPNLIYTPKSGYTGPDHFTFNATDDRTTSEPATISIIVGSPGKGLKGEYFDNSNFTNLKLTRVDQQVNFDWAANSPAIGIAADTFSVRWTGKLLVPETADYTFTTLNSDGVRLFVNGTMILDKFTDRDTRWNDSASISLIAGQKVEIQMDYYENTGSAVAKLKWSGPSLAGRNGAIISKEWLYDESALSDGSPVAHGQTVSLFRNTNKVITLSGTTTSQTPLSYVISTQPVNGSLTGTAPNLTYSPNTGFTGADSFTFVVANGSSTSLPATVAINTITGELKTFFWQNAVSGNWSNSKWRNVAVGDAGLQPAAGGSSAYIMNFNVSGIFTTTHDLNDNFRFNQMNFATAATITGTKILSPVAYGTLLPTIKQNSRNKIYINSPLDLADMTTTGGICTGDVTFSGALSGLGGIAVSGAHRLVIPGLPTNPANTYSGGTIVNSGILHLGAKLESASPLCNDPAGSGPITLNPGATIEFDRVSLSNNLTANGGNISSLNPAGATMSGAVILTDNLTVSGIGGLSLTGNIVGGGGLLKVDQSSLSLTGSNSYSGTTVVKAGTLQCSAEGLGGGPLDIATGGKVSLNFTGTRQVASLRYNGGSPLAPGTYGSSASPAANRNDAYFSGTGTVTIPVPPGLQGLPVSSGLVLRMDASQITGVANGSQLNVWADASGNSNSAVRQSESSSGYPQYISNGINSRPVVRFNSGNSTAGDSLKFGRISTIRSVFWVLKENPDASDYHSLLGDSSTYDFHRETIANGSLWDGFHSSQNIKTGTTRLMGNTINGTTTSLPSGSFQLVSLVTAGDVAAESISQDRVYHGSWQGDIAEILIYDRALTAAEEAQVGSYLATKYGLTTNYPAAGALPAPTGVTAAADTAGAIRVSWAAVTNAVSYRVAVRNTQTGVEQIVTSSSSPCVVAGLNAGTSYEFKVSAGDTNGAFGSLSPSVTATPLSAFATWAGGTSSGLSAANNGPTDDPDRDGISNLLEFILNGSPMVHSRAILPLLTKTNDQWFFSYSRNDLSLSQGAMTQVVEYSHDFKVWTQIPILATSGNGVVITPGSPTDQIRVAIPASAGKPSFARLKVSQ